ncbi:MAG: CinA family nicotinamide mononucleotide deamidase-related protein [Deltaproteobacteria bacterium]|nr:CinA family nicotinamide mononucleotide deamidase-related protein [Deltaproteobacteria bacterium]
MNAKSDYITCEIVTIGSELLLGQIMDTNSSYLAKELGRIGISVSFRTAVGDYLEEIEKVIRAAVDRCDMVITTGGLGPTLDDLTREAIAKAAGVELEFREELMGQIVQIFHSAGYQMPGNNRRQAFVPTGSEVIPNPVGTAPCFIAELDGRPVICLPGVPREMKYLLSREVVPWLKKRFSLAGSNITYKVLKTAGIGESQVDKLIGDLIIPGHNPDVGLLASTGEIKIRITARAHDEHEAQNLIRPVEDEIRLRLGKKIFGEDEDSLEGVIDAMLKKDSLTLAILETFTGGLLAHRLHQLPSCQLIESRVIPHRKDVKQLLGQKDVEPGEEAALILARRIREVGKSDLGLAVPGFPKREGAKYVLNGYAGVAGEGMEDLFSWEMGGELPVLQQRGAVIGLNFLRLALTGKEG